MFHVKHGAAGDTKPTRAGGRSDESLQPVIAQQPEHGLKVSLIQLGREVIEKNDRLGQWRTGQQLLELRQTNHQVDQFDLPCRQEIEAEFPIDASNEIRPMRTPDSVADRPIPVPAVYPVLGERHSIAPPRVQRDGDGEIQAEPVNDIVHPVLKALDVLEPGDGQRLTCLREKAKPRRVRLPGAQSGVSLCKRLAVA